MQIGLKLWSTNEDRIPEASRLFSLGFFNYIELFVVPGSLERFAASWKSLGIPYVLHAPHSLSGLNLSLRDCLAVNRKHINEVERYREALQPERIIFHPGTVGSACETVKQILVFKASFPELFSQALLENKPSLGLNGERCVGANPFELRNILNETELGFCLDYGHAIAYAKTTGKQWRLVVGVFLEMHPAMFHISDGHTDSEIDQHLHFGEGDYDIDWLILSAGADAKITIETRKDHTNSLKDFERDALRVWQASNI